MSLRVCLVTPFAASQPNDVNAHVDAAADALRERGHSVTVIAPSNRAADLSRGRRALKRLTTEGELPDGLLAIGPAVPISRRSVVGLPVGTRANLRLAVTAGGFDVVHAHEPGLPSLGYLALRDAQTLTVATFHSTERLAHPTSKKRREKLLGRIDGLTATSEQVAAAAAERYPGHYAVLPEGIDTGRFSPSLEARRVVVVEWRPDQRSTLRAVYEALSDLPDWEGVLLRTLPLSTRPAIPRALRDRVSTATALTSTKRAEVFYRARAYLPAAAHGSRRAAIEAAASGLSLISDSEPEGIADGLRALDVPDPGRTDRARATAQAESSEALGERLDDLYEGLMERKRPRIVVNPLADRPWISVDLHMHTAHSHDCSVGVRDLLDHAERIGLGAIAITDHNVFSGALEARELAAERELVVIPGEEVKTTEGEVIGLFLEREIEPGMSMEDTISAIRDQAGLVYLPHPFDRLHTVPPPETLHRLLAELDVVEVYNARLLFEGYNDEALRFARKYNLLMGAGSDAHVLQGVGTGFVRMRAFSDAEEFLVSLRTAEIARRPKSLLYLQGLKWMAQARERRGRVAASQ